MQEVVALASWSTLLECCCHATIQSGSCAARSVKVRGDFQGTTSHLSQRKEKKSFSKVNDQSRNIYENKGSIFNMAWQSGNVIENKDSYELLSGNVYENK
jgi:aminoglycoside phosphotransferase family enzyme